MAYNSTYTGQQVVDLLSQIPSKASQTSVNTLTEVVEDLQSEKQDELISGTNIKTINGESILGRGNITISGGSGGGNVSAVDIIDEIDAPSNDFVTTQQLDARGYATLTEVQNMIVSVLNTPL